jgi:molybdopterin/thiamine biosynthesis adenylyltransferase
MCLMEKAMTATERYDRQRRIKDWRQDALSNAHVFVAGAGALGNEIIKNLALAGIGHILVVDFDTIEISNLSRAVLFRNGDIGESKAKVAAKAALSLNHDVAVQYIHGDLIYDVGLGFYRHADLVISGLDNLAARSHVGRSCALAGVPFLDGGMWALGGEVRWFLSGEGPCFECTLSEKDREQASERWSCTGLLNQDPHHTERPQPTTVSTTAVIGGIMAQEAVSYLCGWEALGGEAIVFNGRSNSMHRSSLPRSKTCCHHHAYENVIELKEGVSEIMASELLEYAKTGLYEPAILFLGRDFLMGFYCNRCDQHESVNKPLGRVTEEKITCPTCGSPRLILEISELDSAVSYADRKLDQLGVPPGEVLSVMVKDRLRLYELTGDVKRFWF